MKLNLGAGVHQLDGFVNLDPVYDSGWKIEDGLAYQGGIIEGITISHMLMYVPLAEWPRVFTEFARVLEPGGVIRITEDATDDPKSARFGGFYDAVTLTTLARVTDRLEEAGLRPRPVSPAQTFFHDRSLIQTWHGMPPKVFFVEGIKK